MAEFKRLVAEELIVKAVESIDSSKIYDHVSENYPGVTSAARYAILDLVRKAIVTVEFPDG